MKALQETTKFFLISIFTIAGLLLNSIDVIAGGNVLYERNYSVKLNEALSVKVSAADVEIVGWDKNEVLIIVEGKESIKEKYDFSFSYKGGFVEIIAERKSSWSLWSSSNGFRVKVKVPTEFNPEVKTSGGDIEIKDIIGKIALKTSGGDIEIENSKGNLVAKTSGGDIELNEFVGSSTLKTSGGDIDVKQAEGSVEAKTSGGDVDLIVNSGKVNAGTSGGDISLKYNGINEGVELKTSGGSISVLLPSDFSADVYLKTSGGSIKNNFSSKKIREASKSKFEGKYNNGGVLFSAKTSGGSIYINEK
ncbi:MAG: DUF4097 domain-containing protein [Melioribacteraceae bacterium]|nr:DUF4097 domain-containing protein [Melioribacteraceae bacterium]